MDPFVRGFVRASLVWFGVGVLISISMAFVPVHALAYRTAHIHANLLGFVSMMIFGVAYHVMPRFSGNPLYSRRLAALHLWVANLGLALLVAGWGARPWIADVATVSLRMGAGLSAVGAALFILNIWRTLGPITRTAGPAPGSPAPAGMQPARH